MSSAEYKLISENPLHLIYKKEDRITGKTSIIKKINSPFPSEDLIAQLKNEFENTRRLNISGFRKSIDLNTTEGNYSLELEYVDGKPLKEYIENRGRPIELILEILINVCDVLHEIHKLGHIHGSINGSNILMEEASNQPIIIDGSLMSRFMLKVNYKFSVEHARSILPFISPEQTGRTSKALDHRTDLYSLGVTLYQLLTGKLPFYSEDALELIYAHLSRVPDPPSAINSNISKYLDQVVMKLLEKNAEDRYQSVLGLKWDLQQILKYWKNPDELDIIIGERDFAGELILPQKLYGRSAIIQELGELVDEVSSGNRKTVFISGESGTGKTAIVQELRKPITRRKGFYLEGKFDQLNRNIPYSGWIVIFDEFIQQVLTSGEQKIQEWTYKLKEGLGDNISILHKLIPSLEYLLPQIPRNEEGPTEEISNHLYDLLATFFQIICQKEHPIIVFIDDLQWADNASLNLLRRLATEDEFRYLMLVGAYRSEEVQASDLLFLQIKEMKEGGIEYIDHKIENLELHHIEDIITDCLNTDRESVQDLSRLIFEKTSGNPYFISQFLQSLKTERLIFLDHDKSLQSRKPVWAWQFSAIQQKYVSSNVVELLVYKINESAEETVGVLKKAACIGSNFTLNVLATVTDLMPASLFKLLEHAVEDNYIYYKNTDQIHNVEGGGNIDYQFAHDKIQQAFYSLIQDNEKNSIHFEIGRLLALDYSEEALQRNIFEVVFHLNFGIDLIEDQEQALWMAHLNYDAGLEAKKISAFDAQYEYLSSAMRLVEDFIWEEDQEFAIALETEYMNSLFLTNRIDEAEAFFDALVSRIPTNIGKAEVYYSKMNLYQQLSKIDQILDLGLEGLELLGMKFNPNMGRMALVSELAKTALMMRNKSEDHISSLPEMTDPKMRIAFSLIYKIQVFAFDRNENLMGVLSMRLLQLMMKYGIHDVSMSGLISYGGILAVGFKNYDSAMKYNRLALQLADKSGTKGAQAMAHFGMGMVGYTNLGHEDALHHFKNSVQLAVEAGAHIDAAPGTMYLFALNFFSGLRLSDLRQIVIDNLYLTAKIKTENFHLFQLASLSIIDELRLGRNKKVKSIKEEVYTYEEIDRLLRETEHRSILTYSTMFQMYNHILFDRLEKAKELEKIVINNFNVTRGSVLGLFYRFIQIMMYSRLLSTGKTKDKKSFKKAVKEISSIADHNPDSFVHWKIFAEAELAKINQNPHQAQKLYDEAIEDAKRKNYIQDLAVITYFCALFNREQGFTSVANYYGSSAIKAFDFWGAHHLSKHISDHSGFKIESLGMATEHVSIDQESLLKISELISSEIDIDTLIKKLIQVFCENAGAERVVLILKNNSNWQIAAEQQKDELLLREKSLTPEYLSKSICEYVIRTKKMIMMDEAAEDQRFGQTPYIQKAKPRSLACLPLKSKGDLTGLVYLENTLTSGVFHKDRVRMLNHFSSQIAVALENARLYSDLSKLNRAYERFVPREFLGIMGKTSITEVNLGDQVQMKMTVLFADIQGFTTLSETMNPSEIFSFINEFLSRMSPIIKRYNGFIDKFIGDEIMALFPDSADDAVQCGIAMLHELKVFSDSLAVKNMPPIQIGIGVNTGKLMLGTVGVDNRMNSTVISDTVNIASRVEKDTRDTGAPFMITKATYDHLQDPKAYEIRRLRKATYRGKTAETIVYEVFDSDDEQTVKQKKNNKKLFEKAVKHYENHELLEAKEILDSLSSRDTIDQPCINLLREITLKID